MCNIHFFLSLLLEEITNHVSLMMGAKQEELRIKFLINTLSLLSLHKSTFSTPFVCFVFFSCVHFDSSCSVILGHVQMVGNFSLFFLLTLSVDTEREFFVRFFFLCIV